jgi:hypothetical protein
MINLYNTHIDEIFIHKVGNKARREEVFLSQDPFPLSDEIAPLIKEFFLKPFREKEEQYFKFSEDSELATWLVPYNMEMSQDIARHLYQQSGHPHIKSGEVYVCRLSNIQVDGEKVDGIGIFKSEMKYDFLQFQKNESRLDAIVQQGVSLDKLDKGAIILDFPEPRILYVDANKYDTKYWIDHVLGLEELEDDRYRTKNYLKFCEQFAKDVMRPAAGKQAEISYVNDTINHFAENAEFSEQTYKDEVITDEAMMGEFDMYKMEQGPKYHVEDLSTFDIADETVDEVRKKANGKIEVDTGFSINIPKGTKAASEYLEKGWDEQRQMYYYLVYFNKE